MSKTVILAEKPSAGGDIAKMLGVTQKGNGYYETKAGVVTWGIGHLLETVEPDGYDAKLKKWSFDTLPFIPKPFMVEPKDSTKSQLMIVVKLLKEASTVIIATDADNEGELIAREVLNYAKFKGKIQRMWYSATDATSLRKAYDNLLPGEKTEKLADSALARQQADWLVGMNVTRGMSLRYSQGKGDVVSVGRVQTPTFALVVRRDREIRDFKSQAFYELVATIESEGHTLSLKHAPSEDKRYRVKSDAEAIAQAAIGAISPLSVETERKAEGPKKLFSLSDFSKKANAIWGWSAEKSLNVCQALYERHKATTYPRTDCNYLPEEQIPDVPRIIGILSSVKECQGFFKSGYDAAPKIRKSVFNTSEVTAHHAIIPNKEVEPPLGDMSADERMAYLLIAKQFLAALSPDFEFDETRVSADAGGVRFSTAGRVPRVQGWKDVFSSDEAEEEEDGEPGDPVSKLPPVRDGADGEFKSIEVISKKTKPPQHYTEGTLLADMKSVAKFCDDPRLKALLKEKSGIGTEATRANILKTIRERGYVDVKGKKLLATPKAERIYDILSADFPKLVDPAETARWEDGLTAIAEGGMARDAFVDGIGRYIGEVVTSLKSGAPEKSEGGAAGSGEVGSPTGVIDPVTKEEILEYSQRFQSKGGVALFKEKSGRAMSADDLVKIVSSKNGAEFDGFTWKSGKTGKGRLKVVPCDKYGKKIEFSFDD